ncbi:MAG TPA: hypothetical protein VEF34_09755 [Syntrophobacteraceae bacterium]|nr:hypothetical protein [Syntrophobacteraceae bacterium]
MPKNLMILPVICALLVSFGLAWAASDEASKLRALHGLSEFTPPEVFLNGNFVADEIEPQYVFGKVKDFWKSRSCPSNWLIEDNERNRIKEAQDQTGAFEYTLYLEEDCPGTVSYYVFVDRSRAKSAQWMEWRRNFHRSKTEEQYCAVSAVLEQAARDGFPVDAELRFIEISGDLISKRPEAFLKANLKISPIYDLRQKCREQ